MGVSRQANRFKIAAIKAGQHSDADNLGAFGCRRFGIFHHRPAPGGMNRQDRWFQRPQRHDCLGHRIRNVVKFKVEENRQAKRRHIAHPRAPIGGEKFQPQLDPADMAFHFFGKRHCLVKIGRIERDVDGRGHATPGGAAIGAADGGSVPERTSGTGPRTSASARSALSSLRLMLQRVVRWRR